MKTKKVALLSKFDNLYAHWQIHAEAEGLNQFEILRVRAKLYILFTEMCSCNTNINYTKVVNEFLDQNDLLLAPIDKSKNLCLLTKNDYFTKIREVYQDQEKFELIQENFRKLF